jgi:hypothetical protein
MMWLLLTITSLADSETLGEDAISPLTKKQKKQRMRGLSRNQIILFSDGIQKLVDHWTKCAEQGGDHV